LFTPCSNAKRANVVAIVKRRRAQLLQIQHPLDVLRHRRQRPPLVLFGIFLPQLQRRIQTHSVRTYPPMGSCALVWSVSKSGTTPRFASSGIKSAQLPTSPTDVASPLRTAFFKIRSASSSEVTITSQ